MSQKPFRLWLTKQKPHWPKAIFGINSKTRPLLAGFFVPFPHAPHRGERVYARGRVAPFCLRKYKVIRNKVACGEQVRAVIDNNMFDTKINRFQPNHNAAGLDVGKDQVFKGRAKPRDINFVFMNFKAPHRIAHAIG